MKDEERAAGSECEVEEAVETIDVTHIIKIDASLGLLDAGSRTVPELGSRVRVGNPEGQIVPRDVIGDGAPGEVGTGEVVEARARVSERICRGRNRRAYYLRWRNSGPISESS